MKLAREARYFSTLLAYQFKIIMSIELLQFSYFIFAIFVFSLRK